MRVIVSEYLQMATPQWECSVCRQMWVGPRVYTWAVTRVGTDYNCPLLASVCGSRCLKHVEGRLSTCNTIPKKFKQDKMRAMETMQAMEHFWTVQLRLTDEELLHTPGTAIKLAHTAAKLALQPPRARISSISKEQAIQEQYMAQVARLEALRAQLGAGGEGMSVADVNKVKNLEHKVARAKDHVDRTRTAEQARLESRITLD